MFIGSVAVFLFVVLPSAGLGRLLDASPHWWARTISGFGALFLVTCLGCLSYWVGAWLMARGGAQ
jgi:hypothetical protein